MRRIYPRIQGAHGWLAARQERAGHRRRAAHRRGDLASPACRRRERAGALPRFRGRRLAPRGGAECAAAEKRRQGESRAGRADRSPGAGRRGAGELRPARRGREQCVELFRGTGRRHRAVALGGADRLQPARAAVHLAGGGAAAGEKPGRDRQHHRYPRRAAPEGLPGVQHRQGRTRRAHALACARARAGGARERRRAGGHRLAGRRPVRAGRARTHPRHHAARAHRLARGRRRGGTLPRLRALRHRADPRGRWRPFDLPMIPAPRKIEYEDNKLAKRLRRQVGEAIADFGMIEEGDRVMVCLSGGKDSHALLDVLLSLQEKSPVKFELIAVNLDQKQPGFPAEVLPKYLESRGVPFRIVEQDTYSVVKRVIPEGQTMCSLCSRLRRGALYKAAGELGATRIALGHHRDDVLATFFLNLFHGGQLKAMPAKLRSDDGKHVVIRPLVYVAEEDLTVYAEQKAFPIIPCTLCGSQDNLQRQVVAETLREWEKRYPGRIESITRALTEVRPSHLLDRKLYDFSTLE